MALNAPAQPHPTGPLTGSGGRHPRMKKRKSGSMAAMDLSKVGRGGLAGALSAMDGAKRGPQERLLPSPANPPRPANKKPCSC